MERKGSFSIFGRKESNEKGAGAARQQPVMRYATGPAPGTVITKEKEQSQPISPRATGSSLGMSLLRKFSSARTLTKGNSDKHFDMGIDPNQHLEDTKDVSKSIKVNLNLQKLHEIAVGEGDEEVDNFDVATQLQEKVGMKLSDANELSEAASPGGHGRKGSEINLSSPQPLRERIRTFYEKHDKTKLQKGGLDNFVAFVAKNGVDALNERLKTRYGETLDDVAPISPKVAPATISPRAVSPSNGASSPSGEDSFTFSSSGAPSSAPAASTSPSMVEMEILPKMDLNQSGGDDAYDEGMDSSFLFDGPDSSFGSKSEEYKAMKSRLIDFFVANDPLQAASDPLNRAVHWALVNGEEKLDAVLHGKYGKGIMEFEAYGKVKDFVVSSGLAEAEGRDRPCDHFSLDTTKPFGTCRCGFQKAEHKDGGGATTAIPATFRKPSAAPKVPGLVIPGNNDVMSMKQGLVSPINRTMETGKISSPSVAQRKRAGSKEHAAPANTGGKGKPCSNYSLDMKASTFGVCVCGHPRAAHQSSTPKPASELEKKLASRN